MLDKISKQTKVPQHIFLRPESDHCALSLFSLMTCSLMFWGLVDVGVHESIGNSFTINEGGLGTFFNARRHGFDPPPFPPLNNVKNCNIDTQRLPLMTRVENDLTRV